jgi:hypothetical protein
MGKVDDVLHVVTAYSNPMRWASRYAVQTTYEAKMAATDGVKLTTIECAYGERGFDLDYSACDMPQINRVRVRSKTVCWNKENLLNLAIASLPPDWKYVAWIDGDVLFRKPSWAVETLHALQQYDIVQPWSDAYDLGPKDEHLAAHRSFARQLWHGKPIRARGEKWWEFVGGPYAYPHSGYAWAATRHAMEWVGGLLETGASGSGDHHMALGLVGEAKWSMPGGVTPGYSKHVYQWQDRAVRHINGNVGFVWGTLEHQWHGRKIDRAYVERWNIITRNQFDPDTDLKRNTYRVLELAGNKPQLTRDIDRYFRSRNEDTNTVV